MLFDNLKLEPIYIIGLFLTGIAVRSIAKAILGEIGTLLVLLAGFAAFVYQRMQLQRSTADMKDIERRQLHLRNYALGGSAVPTNSKYMPRSKVPSRDTAFSNLFGGKKYSRGIDSTVANVTSSSRLRARSRASTSLHGATRSHIFGGHAAAAGPRMMRKKQRIPYKGRRRKKRVRRQSGAGVDENRSRDTLAATHMTSDKC